MYSRATTQVTRSSLDIQLSSVHNRLYQWECYISEGMWVVSCVAYFCTNYRGSTRSTRIMPSVLMPSVLWHCWLGGRKGIWPVKTDWWGAGMVICLERGADLHMAQLMPLPLTVSCLSKIQIGFLPFWYQLTWVVLDKGPLNGRVCVLPRINQPTQVDMDHSHYMSAYGNGRWSVASMRVQGWGDEPREPTVCLPDWSELVASYSRMKSAWGWANRGQPILVCNIRKYVVILGG